MLSQTGIYALQAAVYLAINRQRGYILAKEMGEELGIPRQYLSKVLHQLAMRGLLDSQRGKLGGFKLRFPVGEISLYQVVEAVEDTSKFSRCILGQAVCSDTGPCPLHKDWASVSSQYVDMLKTTTLKKLSGNLTD